MNNNGSYINLLAQLKKLTRHNRQGSFKTRERYEEAMKRFCRFLAQEYRLEKLENISSKHIHAYVAYMKQNGRKPSTIKTDLAAIRFWHDKLPRPRFALPENTELKLERRQFGKVNRTWETAEFNEFIGVCWKYEREDYLAVAYLARHAGLRIHECFRLDRVAAEHAIETMQLTVKGKGGKIRTVPISDGVRAVLEPLLSQTERGHKLFVPDDSRTDTEIERMQQFVIRHRDEFQSGERTYPLHVHGLRHPYVKPALKNIFSAGLYAVNSVVDNTDTQGVVRV